MQRDRFSAAQTWLNSARVDLDLAREIAGRFPSRACFHAQQCAELSLKALLIALTDDHPRSHVGDVLVRELQAVDFDVPADIVTSANRLDLFYMGSRYPDALGGADPAKVLQSDDAVLAIERGRNVFAFADDSIERLRTSAVADD